MVEVVTCGECKYCEQIHPSWIGSRSKTKRYYCELHSEGDYCFEVELNFYCALAEKSPKNKKENPKSEYFDDKLG